MAVTLTDEQRDLLLALYERESVQSLRYLVKDKELADFQTLCVALAIIMRKFLISLDTGLGKTLVAIAIMNYFHAKFPGMKWIYLCQNDNLKTTHSKLQDGLYSARAVWAGGDKASILQTFFKEDALAADVLVLPYHVLESRPVNDFLFRNRAFYRGVFLDESQTIGNDDSYTYAMASGLLNNTLYGYMLSATPLRIMPEQTLNQLAILDREAYSHFRQPGAMSKYRVMRDGEFMGYQNLDDLQDEIMCSVISITREDLGMKGKYRVEILWCEARDEYSEVPKARAFRDILGDPEGPALERLGVLCTDQASQGLRGLVYVNLTENKRLVYDRLTELGLNVGILDGTFTNSHKKKDIVHQAYLDGELDVLITNISTGKDLPSDYICFYELTFDFKQMLGRGERGLSGKDMDIYFILVKQTPLIDYFYTNVYERGVFLESLFGKDISELKEAYRQVSESQSRNTCE